MVTLIGPLSNPRPLPSKPLPMRVEPDSRSLKRCGLTATPVTSRRRMKEKPVFGNLIRGVDRKPRVTPHLSALPSCSAELAEKPGTRQVPFPVYRPHGNPQHFRCLLSSKTSKEPQLNKLALAVVDARQHHERFIESNNICSAVRRFVCC